MSPSCWYLGLGIVERHLPHVWTPGCGSKYFKIMDPSEWIMPMPILDINPNSQHSLVKRMAVQVSQSQTMGKRKNMQHNATINWRSKGGNTRHIPGAAAMNPFKAAFHRSAFFHRCNTTTAPQKLNMSPKNDVLCKKVLFNLFHWHFWGDS